MDEESKDIENLLSKREKEIIQVIKFMNKERVSLDEITAKFQRKRGPRSPKNLRSSIASSMRHIEWKTSAMKKPILKKVTGKGRGKKAEYEVSELILGAIS